MATHSSILARKFPWTEETGRPPSMRLQRVRQNWTMSVCAHVHTHARAHTHTHITITPIFLEARGMLDKYSVIKGKHGSALLTVSHYFTSHAAAAAAKSLQSCPGSPVPGILQAKTLEWVAISFSNAWKWKAKVKLLSRVRLLETPWTAAYQAPPSMWFSKQEYWSGVPLHSPYFS